MAACDAVVSLRSPTMGETSGTAIRALSLGKPLVVSANGWFAELPRDVALQVPVDDGEAETLAAALELLASRPDVRAAMGETRRALARREHDLGRVAELYAAACEEAAGGGPVDDAVLREVEQRRSRRRDRARERRGGRARAPPGRGRAWLERLRAIPAWGWLALLILVSFLVRANLRARRWWRRSSWSTSSSTPSSRRASPTTAGSSSAASSRRGTASSIRS